MASQSRPGTRSVWDRLGPVPGDKQAPKFAAGDRRGNEMGSQDSSRSGSPRARDPQASAGGRRRSNRIVFVEANALSVFVTQEAEPSCQTTSTPGSRQMQPTRLLTHSLRQARHSRGVHSRPQSPTSSTHSGSTWSQPSRSWLGGNRGPGALESPMGSVGSGSSASRIVSASMGGQGRGQQRRQSDGGSVDSARRSPPPGLGGPALDSSVAPAHAAAAAKLQLRLEQLQAERRVAEELAEQMLLQAEALVAEKARVQAENSALQKEREDLLEQLEYWQATVALAYNDHSRSNSLEGSPVKGTGAALPGQDARALRQQLEQLQREREELVLLLEASVGLGGLQEQGS